MVAAGLCSAFGWRAARLFYGVFILAYAALFAATARSLPPPAPGATTATPRDRLMTPRVARQSSQGRTLKLVASRKPFTMRLLTTRPALALLFAQFAGMMCEFVSAAALFASSFEEAQSSGCTDGTKVGATVCKSRQSSRFDGACCLPERPGHTS